MADFITFNDLKCPCCNRPMMYCISRDTCAHTVRVYAYCDECAIETKSYPYGDYLAKSDYECVARAIWKKYSISNNDLIEYIKIRRTLKDKAPSWVTYKNKKEMDRFYKWAKEQEEKEIKSNIKENQKNLGDFFE